MFQPELLAKGIRSVGGQADVHAGVVEGAGYGWSVRATEVTFEAWQGDLSTVPRSSRVGALHDRAAAAPDESVATTALDGLQGWHTERAWQIEDKAPFRGDFTWHDVAESPPGAGDYYKEALTWLRCVEAVVAHRDAATVTWTCDLSQFSTLDLVRLLRRSPIEFVNFK